MMRRAIVAVVFLVVSCGVAAAQAAPNVTASPAVPIPLAQQISTLLAAPAVARDHWGIQVTTLDGQPLYSLNEGQLFQPASNAKLFTTAAAMALLGPDTTFETKVVVRDLGVSGTPDASGVLQGDLRLVGGGDANLSGRVLPYVSPRARPKGDATMPPPSPHPLRYLEEMADQVAAKGVKRVTGDVVGDDYFFPWEPYPSDWSIDDMVWGYGAPVSALTVNDNQLKMTVTPAAMAGMPATVTMEPAMPYYELDLGVQTGFAKSGSHVEMERAPGSKVLRIYGSIATDAQPDIEEIALDDPAEYAATAFRAMLEARGIAVQGIARWEHAPIKTSSYLLPDRELTWDEFVGSGVRNTCPQASNPASATLAVHRGPTVLEDITVTNKVSQNLHAELLLHHLGKLAYCKLGSTRAGLNVERAFLIHAGLDPHDFIFFDGSGLSGHDLVTPRATAKLLQYATTQPWFPVWKASLPIGGEDGTLETRFPKPPLKDHLFAKTGTLGEARALSGYLDAASGHTVIFSIMVGNHLPGDSSDRDVMDKIVGLIAASE
jgi:serine-type D-Ala-D-Ala carboxypeptidase/endopeptidase (penicillin-binding protein 4)